LLARRRPRRRTRTTKGARTLRRCGRRQGRQTPRLPNSATAARSFQRRAPRRKRTSPPPPRLRARQTHCRRRRRSAGQFLCRSTAHACLRCWRRACRCRVPGRHRRATRRTASSRGEFPLFSALCSSRSSRRSNLQPSSSQGRSRNSSGRLRRARHRFRGARAGNRRPQTRGISPRHGRRRASPS
jgi:hypothetical protein